MKKRVRIYKSPTGEGQVINKTAQFLRKAQMGGTPDIESLSYPGQGQSQEISDDELASVVMGDISNSRPKEEIVVKLVNMYGKDPMEATNFVNQMYTYLEQQSEAEKEADDEEEDDEEIKSGELETAEEESVVAPEEDFYGDDTNNDAAVEIANEEEEDVDDSEFASDLIMQRGGFIAQDGFEMQNQYPVVFPGVEAYMPENAPSLPFAQYDVATGEVWDNPSVEDMEASYEQFKKGGAYKNEKRNYVNSVLKLVKKQLGGVQDNNPNDLVKKSDQADPIGSGLRNNILSAYVGTLKNQGELAVAKEKAEQEFDEMIRQELMPQTQMMNAPEQMQSLDEAQFGGLFRRRREGQPGGLFNRQPKMPRGMGYVPGMESIDVRRTGIFGRPKEYTINFGATPMTMPGMGGQGYGPGFYGYGYSGPVKTPARKIVEDQAVYVDNKEAAETTSKDEAATTPAETTTTTEAQTTSEQASTTPQESTTETKSTTSNQTIPPKKTNQTKPKEEVVETEVVDENSDYLPWRDYNNYKTKENTTKYDNEVSVKEQPKAQPVIKPVQKIDPNKQNYKTWTTPEGYTVETYNIKGTSNGRGRGPIKPGSFHGRNVDYHIVKDQNGNVIKNKSYAKASQSDYGGVLHLHYDDIKNELDYDPNPKGKSFKSKGKNTISKGLYPNQENYNQFLENVNVRKKLTGRQEGGFVDNPFVDPYGNLQRFVYGGNDDPSLAYINQSDIDYTDSKDTSDAYFQYGGGFNALFPANLTPYYTTRFMGARNAAGQAIPPMLGANANIKSIDVKKTGLLGRPKKYSVTFGHETSDPRKQNLISINQPTGEQTTTPTATTQPTQGSASGVNERMNRPFRENLGQSLIGTGNQFLGRIGSRLIPFGNTDASTQANTEQMRKIAGMFTGQSKTNAPGVDAEQFKRVVSNQSGLPDYMSTPRTQTFTPEPQAPISYGSSTKGIPMGDPKALKDWEKKHNFTWDSVKGTYTWVDDNGKTFSGTTNTNTLNPEDHPAYRNSFAFGGTQTNNDLHRFIPQAQMGGDSPVIYTNNPAMAGVSDAEMIALNPGIQGLEPSIAANIMNTSDLVPTNMPVRDMSNDPEEMIVQGQQSHQIKKTYEPEGDVTLDFKSKMNIDPQAALLVGNAAARGALGIFDRARNRQRERDMYGNLTSDNLFATDPSRDRGDYDTNTGLYRPDQMGQTWNSRSKQFGGENTYLNEDPDYVDGDEVYMTDEEIQDFIANGGEIEYLED